MEIKMKKNKGLKIFSATLFLIFFSNLILFYIVSNNEPEILVPINNIPFDHTVMKIKAELKTKFQEDLPVLITNLRRSFVIKGYLLKNDTFEDVDNFEPQESYLVSIPNQQFELIDAGKEKLFIFPANININVSQTKGKNYEIIF
jgi:hypothetical protein